jgi:GT2 family glycosyltransferase
MASDLESGPLVDIVVVNYRTPGDLTKFLLSVAETVDPEMATVNIINVSPGEMDHQVVAPGSEAMSALQGFVVVSAYDDENVGYARACNFGALRGSAPVIAFFNADVQLTACALLSLVGTILLHDDWGVIGPKQIDSVGRITHAGIVGTNKSIKPRAFHRRDHGQYADQEEVVSVAGAAYLVKRQMWNELTACPYFREAVSDDTCGAFLPTPHYYEESFLSLHARHHGWKVVYDGTVTIQHEWHRASPRRGGNDMELMRTSREIFRRACDVHGIEHE